MNLVLAGYWCSKNDHLSRQPCGGENVAVPIFVHKENEDVMGNIILEAGPGCG